jgi:hypothetical protein
MENYFVVVGNRIRDAGGRAGVWLLCWDCFMDGNDIMGGIFTDTTFDLSQNF